MSNLRRICMKHKAEDARTIRGALKRLEPFPKDEDLLQVMLYLELLAGRIDEAFTSPNVVSIGSRPVPPSAA